VDQPLVYAFYARKDTWRPAIVGMLGVGLYALVALPIYRPLGMVGLILANGVQLAGHATVMIWLFQRRIGLLQGQGIGETTLRTLLASTLMGLAVTGVVQGVAWILPASGRLAWLASVVGGGAVGGLVYLALCAALRAPELHLALDLITQIAGRLGHRSQRPN
jgi:putative peptidoglycan lipid II flippase